MPISRIIGNIFFSTLGMILTSNYKIFDFQNGFTGIENKVLRKVLRKNLDDDFFVWCRKDFAFAARISMSPGEFVFLPAYRLPLPQGFLTAPTEFLTGSCRNELSLPAYRCRNYNYACQVQHTR